MLGVVSLLIMIVPFFICLPKEPPSFSLCLGIFYAALLLSAAFGNFPVPLLGYGVSPIIGYFITILCKVRSLCSSPASFQTQKKA